MVVEGLEVSEDVSEVSLDAVVEEEARLVWKAVVVLKEVEVETGRVVLGLVDGDRVVVR
jgi:hypothetical protein